MSFSYIQGTGGGAALQTSLAYTSNVTAGSLLIAYLGGDPVAVSDNLNGAWTMASPSTTSGSIWYRANSAAGACTVTTTNGEADFAIAEFGTTNPTNITVEQTVANATGTDTTPTTTTSAALGGTGRLVIAGSGESATTPRATYTPGTSDGSSFAQSAVQTHPPAGNGGQVFIEHILSSTANGQRGHATLSISNTWRISLVVFSDAPPPPAQDWAELDDTVLPEQGFAPARPEGVWV